MEVCLDQNFDCPGKTPTRGVTTISPAKPLVGAQEIFGRVSGVVSQLRLRAEQTEAIVAYSTSLGYPALDSEFAT
jgi:hypothetical protein